MLFLSACGGFTILIIPGIWYSFQLHLICKQPNWIDLASFCANEECFMYESLFDKKLTENDTNRRTHTRDKHNITVEK